YLALEINLGDSWINRPPVTDLFCDRKDVQNGLRPYRLQTRYWRPDDNYKQDEALALVERSRLKLINDYERSKAMLAVAGSARC
ncbi:MAG TPA: hypothetical protein PKE45_19635, partial [Caldilineaceae bacterium]|nr:hypothetical protein [Caldilineaceae bacterium]